ncbi:MAG TPA: tripartite tricarboxylate transporter TctB family protein [Bosea sp. (in: a-proteobacteria)]|uniref:tripartite tricarboxylate transporter TctB family protein n=1 Tax=Bosea sp. (in: a-proteobacteria) TaxID=1871050 RepID=UPI002DDD504C|nr:tripartite tricarboxylate transporter TctB family protein [Bosea sp. (in: a-proteobacteria)]HEV2553858.1 tripartite tricarboxylate transporter TctB family protein [Bosea sp. (in: a-proteobacteria)]
MNKIEEARGLRIRSTQDFAAGIFMILLAGLALILARDLPLGSLRQIGPGMLPIWFAVFCAVLGLFQIVGSLRFKGEALQGWSWRGVIFVLGGACVFGLTIRGFDLGPIRFPSLGLLVSGPLVMLISGLAANDMKWKELIIFSVAMSAACILLFKYALSLPIPLAPWLLGI